VLSFYVVARFKLNSRPRALSPVPFSSARRTPSPGICRHFRHFPLKTPDSYAQRSLSLRSFHCSRLKSEIFAPLFSTTCTPFFTLRQRVKRYLHYFLPLPHFLQKCPGVGVPLYSGEDRHAPLGIKSRPIHWSPVVMSLFRHIVTSAFPARNLIRRPIILWRRDTEPFPSVVGVYSGSQG